MGSVLGKVLPLGVATFVMVTAAPTILAWASLLGQVLFRISAKDSLISFFRPVALLAVTITISGVFLNRNPSRTGAAHHEHGSSGTSTNTAKQFTLVLVPGGKEGESYAQATSSKASRFPGPRKVDYSQH